MPKAVVDFDCPYADDDSGCEKCSLPVGHECPYTCEDSEEDDDD